MALCSDQFGDSMAECGLLSDVENWVGVFAVVDAAVVEDYGEEVEAGGFEEGDGGGAGEVFDVCGGDVAYDVLFVVDDAEGGDSFAVHEAEGVADFLVSAGSLLAN